VILDKVKVYIKEMISVCLFKILFFILIILFTIISIFFFGKDNAVEQNVEKIIKLKTGIDIDLSPNF